MLEFVRLSSFLSLNNRVFCNRWNLNRGVKQGGILSAFLFCVHIDDSSEFLENNYNGFKLGIYLINGIILNDTGNRIVDLGFVINVKKTVCIVF